MGRPINPFHGILDNDLKSATVKTYISAIRTVLREIKVKLNEDHFLLNSLTRACKLKNDRITTRLPIHKGMLKMLLNEVNKTFMTKQQPYLAKLYTAIFASAYYGLLQIGEVAPTYY